MTRYEHPSYRRSENTDAEVYILANYKKDAGLEILQKTRGKNEVYDQQIDGFWRAMQQIASTFEHRPETRPVGQQLLTYAYNSLEAGKTPGEILDISEQAAADYWHILNGNLY